MGVGSRPDGIKADGDRVCLAHSPRLHTFTPSRSYTSSVDKPSLQKVSQENALIRSHEKLFHHLSSLKRHHLGSNVLIMQ